MQQAIYDIFLISDQPQHETGNLLAYYNEIMQFVLLCNDRFSKAKDFGSGHSLTTPEAFTLALIEQRPGITVTELAARQRRTKGTMSVRVSSLVKQGYVIREKRPGDDKTVHLYATAEGEKISTLCHSYYMLEFFSIQNELLKKNSVSDIRTFCRILLQFTRILEAENKPS